MSAEREIKPPNQIERRELNAVFETGRRLFRAERFAEAAKIFAECVRRDPANLLHVEAMLQNLGVLHSNQGIHWLTQWINRSARRMRSAYERGEWLEVLRLTPDALQADRLNGELLRLAASAAQRAQLHDVELRYWHAALEQQSSDTHTLAEAAEGFAYQGAFAEARECWIRLLEIDDKHDGAARGLEVLGNFAEPHQIELAERFAESSQTSAPQNTPPPDSTTSDEASHGASLDEAPSRDSGTDIRRLLEQAERWRLDDRFDAAASLVQKAGDIAPGDWAIREQAEQLEIDRKAVQLRIAQRFAQKPTSSQTGIPTSEQAKSLAENLVARLAEDLNRLEIDVFDRRSQRYPDELHWRYELAQRLANAQLHFEAAEQFGRTAELLDQQPIASTKRPGGEPVWSIECHIRQGESFQKVRQFEQALKCYLAAIESHRAASEADLAGQMPKPELNALSERARRRLAVLAEAMGRTEEARIALNWLIRRFPDEQDLQARLDKLAGIEDKG